jgi:hypothetical protein
MIICFDHKKHKEEHKSHSGSSGSCRFVTFVFFFVFLWLNLFPQPDRQLQFALDLGFGRFLKPAGADMLDAQRLHR